MDINIDKREEMLDVVCSIYTATEAEIIKEKRTVTIIVRIIALILIFVITFLFGHFVFAHDIQGLHTVCYTTSTGKCYHAGNCQYLYNSKHKTTVYWAKFSGKRACSKCSVGTLDTVKVDGIIPGLLLSILIVGTLYIIIKKRIDKYYRKQIDICRSINKRKKDMEKRNVHYDRDTAFKRLNELKKML